MGICGFACRYSDGGLHCRLNYIRRHRGLGVGGHQCEKVPQALPAGHDGEFDGFMFGGLCWDEEKWLLT